MEKVPLSVLIPIKNEEKNIRACLESVKWADEIFVVDSQSTDKTIEIAKEYTDKIFQFYYKGGWPKKKNWSLENLPFSHQWVLILDADERIMPELREEIIEVLKNPKDFDGFYVNRRFIFMGRWIKHCGWYPSWNLRFFKHRLGKFEDLKTHDTPQMGDVEVDEHVVLKGKLDFLKNDILHQDYKNIHHFIDRHNRYSDWGAKVYYNLLNNLDAKETIGASFFGSPLQRKRFLKKIWVHLPFRPFLRFTWMYFIRLGFLDGKAGLTFCSLISLYERMVNIKLRELKLESFQKNSNQQKL